MIRSAGLYKGFSLIELAVVVFIISLLLAGLLTPLATSVEQGHRQTMQQQFDDIEDALIGFAIVNGRLPCPDCPEGNASIACDAAPNVSDDGFEDTITVTTVTNTTRITADVCAIDTTGSMLTIEGNLPWATLGVAGTDPWGNPLRYHVDAAYADTEAEGACTPATENTSFSLCTAAHITIQDTGSTCGTAVATIATEVPVVVVSQGGQLATSCNELENTDNDTRFVDTDYNETAATYYDDMIFWISPFFLKSKMLKAERLP